MSKLARSQRIINALNQLQQFSPARRANDAVAINVLTGTSVTPVATDDDEDETGALFLRFPGGESFEVNGDLYLDLQIVEHVRFVDEGAGDGQGRRSKMAADLTEHLRQKHSLG